MGKQALNGREFLGTLACAVTAGAVCTRSISGAESDRINKSTKPAMPKRVLGKTGVNVSILALGGVIGMQLPPSQDHDPAAIAEAALDLGITYFDTAPSYNNGQSETRRPCAGMSLLLAISHETATGAKAMPGGCGPPSVPAH